MDRPPPPPHLSPSAAKWWISAVEAYELHEHHFQILQLACEAWDRTQTARELLEQEGLTLRTEAGGRKAHPAVAIERDARLAVARLIRELDLDIEPPASDRYGPPPILSNRGSRARKDQNS